MLAILTVHSFNAQYFSVVLTDSSLLAAAACEYYYCSCKIEDRVEN